MQNPARSLIASKTIALKATASLAVVGFLLCGSAAMAAKPAGKPAGGAGRPVAHAAAPRAAVPHFNAARPMHFNTARAVPHFRPHAVPHLNTARAHVSPRIPAHVAHSLTRNGRTRFNRATNSPVTPLGKTDHTNAHTLTTTAQPLRTNRTAAFPHHPVGGADPAAFAAHRHFAANGAFRPFFNHGWHPHHHLGWVGPLFWPYAYGDFFYYALWPDDYADVDPFWAYGYGDIYESVFSPYDYDQYVQGSGAPQRMTTLTEGMAQSCADEAAEVTGWPVNQIQDAVQPNGQQSTLLDELGNAIVKASDEVKSHCPTTVAFTPTDRLAQMRTRLQGLVDAVNLVSPPLTKFYDTLSDEQKARFNDIAPLESKSAQAAPSEPQPGQGAPTVQAQCNTNVMAWPGTQIDNTVHPNDAQRAKLEALQSALSQAAGDVKAACPDESPATPPARLAAAGARLKAMLQGVEAVQPTLNSFYTALSDDQKARFNKMGQELFAQSQ